MIESDTIKLLRECDAGIKMGVASIDDVLDYELRERTLWSKISPLLLSIVFVIPLEWYMHQTIVGWSKMEKSWHKQREQFLRRHGGH